MKALSQTWPALCLLWELDAILSDWRLKDSGQAIAQHTKVKDDNIQDKYACIRSLSNR